MNAAPGSATSSRPSAGHLEDANLLGRAEAVLARAQESEAREALALEGQHHIDDVLERLGPGERPVLGHVADEHHRHAVLLGIRLEQRRAAADLANRAGRAFELVGGHRLDRVDDDQRRGGCLRRGDDALHGCLGQDVDLLAGAPPQTRRGARRASAQLCRGLLAGRVQDAPVPDGAPSRRTRASTSVDLPMPGSPPSRTSEPGTRPPPRTRSTSRMPSGRRSVSVAESEASGVTGGAAAVARFRAVAEAPCPRSTGVSTSVFQPPQLRHWPSQRRLDAPHVPHT